MPADLIGDLVRLGALRSPDRSAIKMREGRSITYRLLDERTTRLAHALLGSGLERGQRVAGWLEDSIEYVELYLAVAKAGLVMVPINSRYRAEEASFQIQRSGAQALFYSAGTATDVLTVLDKHEFTLVATPADPVNGQVRRYEDLLAAASSTGPPPPPDEDDPVVIAFTSGTTGFPKGATHTHRSVKNICRTQGVSLRLPVAGVAAQIASMSFPATVMGWLISHMYVGGTTVLMGHVDVEMVLDTLAKERVTSFYLPNPMIAEFIERTRQDPSPLDSVLGILQAGARMDPEVLRELAGVIGTRYIAGWGMTEIGGGIGTASTIEDMRTGGGTAKDFFASVGRAVPDTLVGVVDEAGKPLPHDGESVGELTLYSSSVMAGYWNDAESTARALRDGWYFSGDMGAIDRQGYVYISDRRRDLIVSGGANIYPAELEFVLGRMDGVKECAVVGMPHPRWGASPVAVVVKQPGIELSEQDVLSFMIERLASYKKPQRVVFVDALPRNTSNKLMKQVIRDRLADQFDHQTKGGVSGQ